MEQQPEAPHREFRGPIKSQSSADATPVVKDGNTASQSEAHRSAYTAFAQQLQGHPFEDSTKAIVRERANANHLVGQNILTPLELTNVGQNNNETPWFGGDIISNLAIKAATRAYPIGSRIANELKRDVERVTFWGVDEIKERLKHLSNDYREFEKQRARITAESTRTNSAQISCMLMQLPRNQTNNPDCVF